jgi:hypothetical protein
VKEESREEEDLTSRKLKGVDFKIVVFDEV